jgi:hypothetical protein
VIGQAHRNNYIPFPVTFVNLLLFFHPITVIVCSRVSGDHRGAFSPRVVDSYGISARWEDALTGYGKTNLVFTSRGFQPCGAWEAVPDRTFHFVGAMLASDGHRNTHSGHGTDGALPRACSGSVGGGCADDSSDAKSHAVATPSTIDSGGCADDASVVTDGARSCPDDIETEFIEGVKLAAGSSSVVYVSMGTAVSTGAKFWRIVARAFPPDSGVHVVCSLGRYADNDASAAHPAGANVQALRSVPQTALLASGLVSVFVTHAGMNSIHESLWHGVPMVCVPHIGDQLYNASVVQDAGAGVMVDAYDVTVESLRQAFNEVCTRTSHRTPSRAFVLCVHALAYLCSCVSLCPRHDSLAIVMRFVTVTGCRTTTAQPTAGLVLEL